MGSGHLGIMIGLLVTLQVASASGGAVVTGCGTMGARASCADNSALARAVSFAKIQAIEKCEGPAELIRWQEHDCQEEVLPSGTLYSTGYAKGQFDCLPQPKHSGDCLTEELQSGCYTVVKWMGGGHDGPKRHAYCYCKTLASE